MGQELYEDGDRDKLIFCFNLMLSFGNFVECISTQRKLVQEPLSFVHAITVRSALCNEM
jgi:hypothetical protein